jgi:N-acyl homoserine lactone hydrolase
MQMEEDRTMKGPAICIIVGGAALIAASASIFMLFFWYGFRKYNVSPYVAPVRSAGNWDAIFKNSTTLEVTPLVTGYAVARPNARPYLNPESLSKIDVSKEEMSPIISYWIRTANKRDILIDSGLDGSFQERPFGKLPFILRNYQRRTKTVYMQKKGQALSSYLALYNIHPEAVFFTHLHPDHVCGNLELADGIPFVFSAGENSFFYKSIAGKFFLNKKNVRTLDFKKAVRIPPFSRVIGLDGDNSIWAVATPGHTEGHVSYLLNDKESPILIVGDLSVSKDLFLRGIESSSDSGKKGIENLRKSLSEISEFKERYPNTRICFSHSEEIWR